MSWQIRYLEQERVVVVKTSGPQDMAMARQMVTEAVELSARFDAKRFLKDDRDSVLQLTAVEIYSFPNLLLEAGIPRDCKIAVIINANSLQASDFQFFKSRMYNEGIPDVRIFDGSEEQALEWLVEPPPPKSGPRILP
jgi:hypothetical protein